MQQSALNFVYAAAAVGGTAYNVEQSSRAAADAKEAAADADARQRKAAQDLLDAQEAASSQAQAAIDQRRKRIAANNTIYTNPLGIADQAANAKKSILGL